MTARSQTHEERRLALNAMVVLAGFEAPCGARLPPSLASTPTCY